jgi:hypothetical protein
MEVSYESLSRKRHANTQLADESTELYKKTWREIYEMLKQELMS